MKFIDTEEKELLAMRNIFIASEIGGISSCLINIKNEPFGKLHQAAMCAIKGELGDLLKQIDLMGKHLSYNYNISIPSEVRSDVFLKMINHYGNFSYAIKHFIRGTQNIDRHIDMEQEYYDMYMCAIELCLFLDFDPHEILTLGEDIYKERFDKWVKAGRKGLWV